MWRGLLGWRTRQTDQRNQIADRHVLWAELGGATKSSNGRIGNPAVGCSQIDVLVTVDFLEHRIAFQEWQKHRHPRPARAQVAFPFITGWKLLIQIVIQMQR